MKMTFIDGKYFKFMFSYIYIKIFKSSILWNTKYVIPYYYYCNSIEKKERILKNDSTSEHIFRLNAQILVFIVPKCLLYKDVFH